MPKTTSIYKGGRPHPLIMAQGQLCHLEPTFDSSPGKTRNFSSKCQYLPRVLK